MINAPPWCPASDGHQDTSDWWRRAGWEGSRQQCGYSVALRCLVCLTDWHCKLWLQWWKWDFFITLMFLFNNYSNWRLFLCPFIGTRILSPATFAAKLEAIHTFFPVTFTYSIPDILLSPGSCASNHVGNNWQALAQILVSWKPRNTNMQALPLGISRSLPPRCQGADW